MKILIKANLVKHKTYQFQPLASEDSCHVVEGIACLIYRFADSQGNQSTDAKTRQLRALRVRHRRAMFSIRLG